MKSYHGITTGIIQIPARTQGNKKAPVSRGLDGSLVELMGIEPTASRVRFLNDASNPNDFAELERQETSENVPKRPILAVYRHNSEAADPVAEWLGEALRAWAAHHEPRELRKVLLTILGLLDE